MCAENDGWPKRGWWVAGEELGGWWVTGDNCRRMVAWLVWLVSCVFGMAYRYRTEPKLRNIGNTYTARHRIRIGIDRTARLQPSERVPWKCQRGLPGKGAYLGQIECVLGPNGAQVKQAYLGQIGCFFLEPKEPNRGPDRVSK